MPVKHGVPGSNGSAHHAFARALYLVTHNPRPRYRLGAEVHLADPHPDELDCSEFVQWATYQETGNAWVDGSYNQAAECKRHGLLIPVKKAFTIPGALLFVSRDGKPSGVHHVAFSDGKGGTAEARGRQLGCGAWPAGSRFNMAGLVPVLRY